MRFLLRAFLGTLLSFILVFSPDIFAAQTINDIEEVQRISVGNTYDVLTLPAGTQYLILQGVGTVVYYKVGCSDADAAPGADYEEYAADQPFVRAVGYAIQQGKTICVASSAASTLQITPTVAAP